LHVLDGELAAAECVLDESDAIGDARIGFARLSLAGFRGDEVALSRLAEAAEAQADARGEG
jgi:hypothetical protein